MFFFETIITLSYNIVKTYTLFYTVIFACCRKFMPLAAFRETCTCQHINLNPFHKYVSFLSDGHLLTDLVGLKFYILS